MSHLKLRLENNKFHNIKIFFVQFVEISLKEKVLLTLLLHNYKNVIENKRTDATNIYLKNWAWEKMRNEHNSQGYIICCKRTIFNNKSSGIKLQELYIIIHDTLKLLLLNFSIYIGQQTKL